MTIRTAYPPSDEHAAPRDLAVVSVPAGHPYVQALAVSPGIRVLPDPVVPGAPGGTWWPPVALSPAWIAQHADDADVLHIHFGTESFPVGHVSACIDAAHDAGWGVVFTAHDLDHPQLSDQSAYHHQLDEAVLGADAVITLTGHAAATIAARWGRDAVVIPHPSLLPPAAAAPPVRPVDELRIGMHLKDLRPNVDGPEATRTLIDALRILREAGIAAAGEVRLHHLVRDEAARDEIRRLCADADETTLLEHERLSDAELATALSRLDVCVLPYRHGTHSGWLELCWDLGVPVAAPTVGAYLDQHPDGGVVAFRPSASASLADAVVRATEASRARPGSEARRALVDVRRRIRQTTDAEAVRMQAEVYRRVLRARS